MEERRRSESGMKDARNISKLRASAGVEQHVGSCRVARGGLAPGEGIQAASRLHAGRTDGRITMRDDPIVEEIRQIKREHAARYDYDIRRMVKAVRDRQPERGRVVASRASARARRGGTDTPGERDRPKRRGGA